MKSHLQAAALGALAFMLIPASLAGAKTYPHEPAGVSVDVPDKGWKVDGDDNSLQVSSDDDLVSLTFAILEDANALDRAMDAIEKELAKTMTDIKMGKVEELTHNGMRGVVSDGTAKIEGAGVELGIMVLETPKKKMLLVMGIGAQGKMTKHEKDVERILGSIKPMQAPARK